MLPNRAVSWLKWAPEKCGRFPYLFGWTKLHSNMSTFLKKLMASHVYLFVWVYSFKLPQLTSLELMLLQIFANVRDDPSGWFFLLLTLQCLKLYSAVLFKNAFSKHMQMHQIQEFPIVFKFLKNQQPDFRKEASLYYPCIHSWKKNAINNFTLQNW